MSVENLAGSPEGHVDGEIAPEGRAGQALDAVIDVLEDIQRIVIAGRPKALRVRFGDKTVAELPLALTAAAAFAAGLAAVVLTKLTVEIVSED